MTTNSAVHPSLWNQCLRALELELSEQQFHTWIRPLQPIEEDGVLKLLAPNRFVIDWVEEHCLEKILTVTSPVSVLLDVGSRRPPLIAPSSVPSVPSPRRPVLGTQLNDKFTFDKFVEGKSNQLGRAAALQVASNPGRAYNPLFIYGGVGLGKTHLMHAVGNAILQRDPAAKVAYVHSERFVGDMVRGLQHNTIADFKRSYRSLDALLIDDIQFFAGKERSQEEFFHTFNVLLEGQRQIIQPI